MRGAFLTLCAATSLGACMGERITAPEAMRMVAAWDSAAMTDEAGYWIGISWAQVNSFENLPVPFRLPVELDGETGTYRVLVIERQFENSPREAGGCPSQDIVALILWADAADGRGLDFLTFTVGAERGAMGGRFVIPVWDEAAMANNWRCGPSRTPKGVAHVVPHDGRGVVPSGSRPANDGEIKIRRRGASSACDFLKAPEELEWYGATCAQQSYDVEVNALLKPDTTGWAAARGALRIRVSSQNVRGAIFVTNCTANTWTREFCPDTTGVPWRAK